MTLVAEEEAFWEFICHLFATVSPTDTQRYITNVRGSKELRTLDAANASGDAQQSTFEMITNHCEDCNFVGL